MKISQNNRRRPRIEILPLIDVVFLLLVFFIYAMLSMAVHHAIQVSLPKSATAEDSPPEWKSVTLTDTGSLYLDGELMSAPALRFRLATQQSRKPIPGIRLYADKNVSYSALFNVLDLVRESGVQTISLQAEIKPLP